MAEFNGAPFYNTVDEEMDKGYVGVLFSSGKAIQSRELTEIGSFARAHTKKVANLLYKSGTIISDCAIKNIDKTNKIVTMSGGSVFVDGEIFDIDVESGKNPDLVSKTVPIKTSGTETIYVEVVIQSVDSTIDTDLLDPAEGFDNYGEPGASRLRKIARYISTSHQDFSDPNYTSNPRFPIYTLIDGEVVEDKVSSAENTITEEKPADSSAIDAFDVIAQRNYETLGNYLVEGFQVKSIECADATKIGISVAAGVAYINGVRREISDSRKIYIKKNLLQHTIINEDHVIDSSTNEYLLYNSPVIKAVVSAPLKTTIQLVYSSGVKNTITPPAGYSVYKIIQVYTEGTSGKTYTEGSDYTFARNQITWLNTGTHPASSFKVDYTYKPVLDSSKYRLKSKGIYERVLRLPVNSLGIAEIPAQYYNPAISYIENASKAGVELTKGTDWYQQGNKIKLVTKSSTIIPVEVVRTSGVDTIGISGGIVKDITYYSEAGVRMYSPQSSGSADYDYTFNSKNGSITWNGEQDYFPAEGETYIANTVSPTASAANISYINVKFAYESSQDMYTARVYDSYIEFDSGAIKAVSNNDTITIDSTIARTRKDSICLDRDGNLVVVHGTVIGSDGIYETRVSTDLLKIADIVVKPTTARDVAIYQANSYRVRMQDLREMFNKVKDMDYNISLTTLESYAEDLAASATLRGVVTDGFVGMRMFDGSAIWNFASDESQFAVPNIAEAKLYPGFLRYSTQLQINTANTTAGKKDKVYVLSNGNAEVKWIEQPYGTSSRSLTEGVYESLLFPTLEISPDSDYFISGALSSSDEDEYIIVPRYFNAYIIPENDTLTTSVSANAFKNGNMTLEFWANLQDRKETTLFFAEGAGLHIYVQDGSLYVRNGLTARPLIYTIPIDMNNPMYGNWHHFAFVYGNNSISHVYYDGEEVHYISIVYAMIYPYLPIANYTNCQIKNITNIRFGGSFELGLADIRMYNEVIPLSTIRTYMLAEIVPEENVMAYYTGTIGTDKLISNSAISSYIGKLTASYNVTNSKIDIDDVDESNPITTTNHIVNTIDVTQGNIKPEDSSTTTITGSNTTTKTSYSSRISGNWRYNTTTTTTTTTTDHSREDIWYTKERESQVEDYGTFLSNIEAALTLRRIKILVHGTGLLPNTDPIEITFNGVKVNLFEDKDVGQGEKSDTYGCWKADANGEFTAAFVIPKGVPVGVREVVMNIPGGPEAKTMYWGAGSVIEKTNVEVQTDTIYWKENRSTTTWQTSNSTTKSSTTSTCISNCSRCVSRCYTCPLGQTIFVNDPDTCTPLVKDCIDYSNVEVTSVDLYVRNFKQDTQFFVGFIELSDSGYPSSNLDRWVSEVKIFSGADLTSTTGKFEYGTAKYNVKFDNPIKLKGGKGYALVVGSPDNTARIWVAKVGEDEPTINNVKGQTIYQTPDKGMLLSSPNSKTWVAYIDEDMKYAVYIKDFFASGNLTDVSPNLSLINTSITGKCAIVEYKEVVFNVATNRAMKYPNFFKYDVMYSDNEDRTGYIVFEYATRINGIYGDWIEFVPGSIVQFTGIADAMKIRAKIISFNRYSSPSIDSSAALVVGEYKLPSHYISRTISSGRYNRVNIYIDKFFNDQLSDILVKYSPDGGYTWREPSIDKLVPLELSNSTYGENTQIYQYCLYDGLTLDAPEILSCNSISTPSGQTSTKFANNIKYEIAYCLKDIYDREGPLSTPATYTGSNGKAPRIRLKFDPNATGYAVYVRDVTHNGEFVLWYDGTVTSTLKSNMSLVDYNITIGPEGRLFPTKGVVLVGSEYITYEGKTKSGNNYILGGTARGSSNLAQPSSAETHLIGDKVILADNCTLNRGSITGTATDLWKFANYTIYKDSDTGESYYVFEETLVDKNLDTTADDVPQYDESYPASFESEKITYRIKLSNKESTSTVGRPDLIPTVGRLIINTSYESY